MATGSLRATGANMDLIMANKRREEIKLKVLNDYVGGQTQRLWPLKWRRPCPSAGGPPKLSDWRWRVALRRKQRVEKRRSDGRSMK